MRLLLVRRTAKVRDGLTVLLRLQTDFTAGDAEDDGTAGGVKAEQDEEDIFQ